jgi:hypothetical protein
MNADKHGYLKMLFVREKRKGRKNAKSFYCVMSYSRFLRFSRAFILFLFAHKGTGTGLLLPQ